MYKTFIVRALLSIMRYLQLAFLVYTIDGCPYCTKAIRLLNEHGIEYVELNIDSNPIYQKQMDKKYKQSKAFDPKLHPKHNHRLTYHKCLFTTSG